MDWTAFSLSLQLAAWTVALLLPIAILIARLLAWGDFRCKSVARSARHAAAGAAADGARLLSASSPSRRSRASAAASKSLFGGQLVFSFAGILVASLIINLPFAVQPIQRAFEAIPRNVREAAFVSGLSRWETLRRIELPLAWPGIVSAVALDLRAHAGRVRRHPDDRRQHPRRDARAVDLHLRQRAGLPPRSRQASCRRCCSSSRLAPSPSCTCWRGVQRSAPMGREAAQLSVRAAAGRPDPARRGARPAARASCWRIVGPSGSGKTTVLRSIAGLYRPAAGRVVVGGETWLDTEAGIDLPPQARSVGLVFQDYALFPHLSALDNVRLAMLRP